MAMAIVLLLNLKVAKSQAILNADFESWQAVTSYEDPTSWMTSNAASSQVVGLPTVLKSTTANSGQYAAQLQTAGTALHFPGVITNGVITSPGVGQITFSGGTPWTTRSQNLTGYFQYTAGGGADSALVTAILFHRNGANRDTIAVGRKGLGAQATYAQFTLNFNYHDWSSTMPDSVLIIVQSSKNILSAQTGTVLLIDDIALHGNVAGINNTVITKPSVAIYPNPASSVVRFSFKGMNNASTLNIYDLLGKKIKSITIDGSVLNLETEDMDNGMYFYQVSDLNNAVLSTGKFSIKK